MYINKIIVIDEFLWINFVDLNHKTFVQCLKLEDDVFLEPQFEHVISHTQANVGGTKENVYISYSSSNRKNKEIIYFDKDGSNKIKFHSEIMYSKLMKITDEVYLGIELFSNTINLFSKEKILDKITFDKTIHGIKYLNGKYILVTEKGIHYLNIEDEKLKFSPVYFEHLNVNNAYLCMENLLWLVTLNEGLHIINNDQSIFFNLTNIASEKRNVTALFRNEDEVLAACDNGEVFKISNDHAIKKEYDIKYKVNEIKESNGKLAFATSLGLWLAKNGKAIRLNNHGMKDFEFLSDSNYVCSQYNGIRISKFEQDANIYNSHSLLKNRSYAVELATNGVLWIGNTKGVFHLNAEDYSLINTKSEIDRNVSDIVCLPNNHTYVSTFAGGVYEFIGTSLNKKLDLPNDKIMDLDYWGDNIAIASSDQIFIYNTIQDSFTVINNFEHLADQLIQCVLLSKDHLFVGTNVGVCKIDLESQNKYKSTLVSIKEVSTSQGVILDSTNYTLDAGVKNLSFDYVGVSHLKKDKIEYKYRMLGMDDSWVSTKQSKVSYSAIDGGSYTFQVKAADDLNESNIAQIQFSVKKAVHEHWLFKLISFLVFGLCVYLLTRWYSQIRLKEENRKQAELRSINGMKMTALQNHMNPHFISNALYSIQDLIEDNKTWEAGEYTSSFAELIRKSMRYATMERISLDQELQFLKVYLELETTRMKRRVETKILLPKELEALKSKILIPPLLIQPIVKNSFKHAMDQTIIDPYIHISFDKKDSVLQCIVKDNGVGYSNNRKKYKSDKKSTGIDTVVQRLKLNAKQLMKDETKKLEFVNSDEGTTVKILIDISYE